METDGICGFRETICALAGPLGSFLLMLLCRRFPRVAVSGAIQGIYNLLPLFPLDGGRAIRSILFSVLPPPKAKRLFQISQVCVVVLLCIGSCILLFRIGLLIIPIVFLLFRRKWNENSLAKLSF